MWFLSLLNFGDFISDGCWLHCAVSCVYVIREFKRNEISHLNYMFLQQFQHDLFSLNSKPSFEYHILWFISEVSAADFFFCRFWSHLCGDKQAIPRCAMSKCTIIFSQKNLFFVLLARRRAPRTQSEVDVNEEEWRRCVAVDGPNSIGLTWLNLAWWCCNWLSSCNSTRPCIIID